MSGKGKSSFVNITSAIAISILCILIISGCKTKKPVIKPEIASSEEALYKEGEKYIKKDPERSRLYFRQVIDSFPKGFYAQQAQLAIADSYFQKGDEANMILAASEYRDFVARFPASPSAPYAQYQVAMTYYKKMLSPGRDPTKTQLAVEEFKRVLTKYPTSEEAKQAQEKILECEERLAAYAFQIGRYYYKVGAYRAAISRLREILTVYPSFSKMDRVYFFLGASYFKGRLAPQSVSYFTKLVSDYPQSKFAKKAQKYLEEIDKMRKEAEKKAPPKKKIE
jgi:outer membrane protein assembly factor BamD